MGGKETFARLLTSFGSGDESKQSSTSSLWNKLKKTGATTLRLPPTVIQAGPLQKDIPGPTLRTPFLKNREGKKGDKSAKQNSEVIVPY